MALLLTACSLIVPVASANGRSPRSSRHSRVPPKVCPIDWRKGTWHVKQLIRCAADHWSVPGGARKALYDREPRVALPPACVQLVQRRDRHLPAPVAGTGPAVPTRTASSGWSAFNARANIIVTMRMVKRGRLVALGRLARDR